MKLRKKSLQRSTIIFLLVMFTLVAIGLNSFIRLILLEGLNGLEEKYVKEHVGRVERSIQDKLSQLRQTAQDYAAWDDSYDYITDQNQAYETENLHHIAFLNLDLDMMVYVDQSGNYVYAKGMDMNREKQVPIYEGLRENLKKSSLLTNTNPDLTVQGIIVLDEGPMLIASYPIVRSDYSGPVKGNLIVGRFLNQKTVDSIGKNLDLKISVQKLNGTQSSEFNELTALEPIRVQSINKDTILAYTLLNDLFNQPATALIVSMDREFTTVGRIALNRMITYLPIVPIMMMLLISYFFNSRVLMRLKKLSGNVVSFGERHEVDVYLPEDLKNDEISVVNDAINSMLMRLKTNQDALKASETRYRKLVEAGRDVIFTADFQGIATYISPNCEEIIDCLDHVIIGWPFSDIIHSESLERWRLILQQASEGCRMFDIYEFLGKAGNGTWQWFRMDISIISHEDESAELMGVFYNIHERKLAEFALVEAHANLEIEVALQTRQLVETNSDLAKEIALRKLAHEKIEQLAFFDSLTGLPNRLLLVNRIKQAIDLAKRIEKPIGFLFLDLDGFKTVNDTLGHSQGDELLKAVGVRLSKYVRESDTVARMGGDEFIIMVQNLENSEQIHTVSDKIIDAFKHPFDLNHNEIFVTVSIGMSIYPIDGESHEALIKNADLAMYKAKENGKNQSVLCTTIMKDLVVDNMKLSNSLYRALERNELEVYYQPQISLVTKQIVGLEALLRWNHPELGMVSPGRFIHLAEQTGLIIPIGKWVMQTVCLQNKSWQDAGLPHIRIAVNLSIIQFQCPGIVDEVREILDESNLSPQYLELEITESIAMRDTEHIVKVLKAFQEMGIYISVDDFGTEFSSLKYLKLLPINRIKIPMPFIQGIEVDVKDEAITKTIIVLAKNMGLEVIAEGVETKQQEAFLSQRMCDEMQGFYYHKPMPANEIELLLREVVHMRNLNEKALFESINRNEFSYSM